MYALPARRAETHGFGDDFAKPGFLKARDGARQRARLEQCYVDAALSAL